MLAVRFGRNFERDPSELRKLLVIAYHFPPAGGRGAAGSLRALKFTRYLPSFGWQPTVLTINTDAYPENTTIDDSLSRFVAGDLSINRTRVLQPIEPLLRMQASIRSKLRSGDASDAASAGREEHIRRPPDNPPGRYQRVKDGITDLFKIPDEVSGWFFPAVWRGRQIVRRYDVDAILATGRPWTSLVVGAAVKKLTGRPLIVDFRDPWVSNPFRQPPSRFKDMAERRLERWVIRSAYLVIANTENLPKTRSSRWRLPDVALRRVVRQTRPEILYRCVALALRSRRDRAGKFPVRSAG